MPTCVIQGAKGKTLPTDLTDVVLTQTITDM